MNPIHCIGLFNLLAIAVEHILSKLDGKSKILESLKISPDDISDKKEAEAFRILLKIIEQLNMEVNVLKAELQKTRDELSLRLGLYK
jgi:predicted house-cleaning noncanonical NTP pyrophosphatase (MazG superfamily)